MNNTLVVGSIHSTDSPRLHINVRPTSRNLGEILNELKEMELLIREVTEKAMALKSLGVVWEEVAHDAPEE